jgi:hypothetical protein
MKDCCVSSKHNIDQEKILEMNTKEAFRKEN